MLLIIIFAVAPGATAQGRRLSGGEILKAMSKKYASITSYQSEGVVETVADNPMRTRSRDVDFKLYFSRPNKLRFEWVANSIASVGQRNLVWSDGGPTFSLYSFAPEKVETRESLERGLAGAAGISLGSAVTIPKLLLTEISGFSLRSLRKVRLKGTEKFEGHDCYVLEGYHPDGERWQLWLGRRDLSLRKLSVKLFTGELQEEIHRNIKVNVVIPPETYRLSVRHVGPIASSFTSPIKNRGTR